MEDVGLRDDAYLHANEAGFFAVEEAGEGDADDLGGAVIGEDGGGDDAGGPVEEIGTKLHGVSEAGGCEVGASGEEGAEVDPCGGGLEDDGGLAWGDDDASAGEGA